MIEYYQDELPGELLPLLDDPAIEGHVSFPVPGYEQEQEAMVQAAHLLALKEWRHGASVPLEPAEPPKGYLLCSEPTLLLRVGDGRWMALALSIESECEGLGILIYEHCQQIAFFTADEAAMVWATILQEVPRFQAELHPDLSARHGRAIAALLSSQQKRGSQR